MLYMYVPVYSTCILYDMLYCRVCALADLPPPQLDFLACIAKRLSVYCMDGYVQMVQRHAYKVQCDLPRVTFASMRCNAPNHLTALHSTALRDDQSIDQLSCHSTDSNYVRVPW
jgi:hypothetical protein